MDTKTSNLQVCLASDDIIELFESLGFTSDTPPDVELLRHSIVEIIQYRVVDTLENEITIQKFEAELNSLEHHE